jgi:DNA-binding beta-propeller fold protein YncE
VKSIPLVVLAASALVLGHPCPAAAQTAKFRFVAAAYSDEKGAGLSQPEGIACDARGVVIVADTGNDRLLRFAYQDKTVTGGSEIRIPELTAPSRVRMTSKDEIYALDSRQHRIVHLGADGQFRDVVSFTGAPSPSSIVVKSFALDDADNLYVLDVLSARVLILNASGQFQKALPLPADAGFVSDVTVDSQGRVLLLDSIARRLYSAAKDADAFTALGPTLSATLTTLPTTIATSAGTIFVAEGLGSDIVSFGPDGTFLARQLAEGRVEGFLEYPTQLCFTGTGDMFVADRDNSRVQVFAVIR